MEKNEKAAAEWQTLITGLQGVYAAHVVFSDLQEPLEIHVLADKERSTKSLVRDVQSALSARFGVEIDYRIISIAQTASRMLDERGCRLVYDGVSVHATPSAVEVTVTLRRNGECYTGGANGTALQFSRLRCVAQATLEAVEACLGGTPQFELAHAEIIRLGERLIAVAQIYSVADAVPLVGCVFAEANADAAVVKSVLDAVNRKIGRRV